MELIIKGNKIVNVLDPTANQDAATKKYVDDSITTSEGNLDNYYTKVQTYSQDEIIDLIQVTINKRKLSTRISRFISKG